MKTGINTLRIHWDTFLFEGEKCNALPILFFRVAIGLFLMGHFLAILQDIPVLFGPHHSIFPAEIANLFIDKYILTLPKLYTFSGLSVSQFLYAFCGLYLLITCFIIIGFYTRISAIFLLLLNTALIKSNVFFAYGVDFFTSMSLFYLILFPEIPIYSFRTFLKKESQPENYIFFRRFLQIHLSIAYFYSGLNKVLGFNWRNGEAVWKAINLPYSNVDFSFYLSWLQDFPAVLILLCWFVIIIELFHPIIFLPKIKNTWLWATIAMHVGIAFILNLYFFSAMMIIWNITAFYDFDVTASQNNFSWNMFLKKKVPL